MSYWDAELPISPETLRRWRLKGDYRDLRRRMRRDHRDLRRLRREVRKFHRAVFKLSAKMERDGSLSPRPNDPASRSDDGTPNFNERTTPQRTATSGSPGSRSSMSPAQPAAINATTRLKTTPGPEAARSALPLSTKAPN